MQIKLHSKYFEETNYKATITCNGQEVQSDNINCWELADESEELEISMQLENVTYNHKMGLLIVCIGWILHFFSGCNRYLFGYPYDYILKIAVKKSSAVRNIDLYMNSYKYSQPFAISSPNCTILQNEYVAVAGYKWKWVASSVVPVLILSSFVLAIFFAIFLKHSMLTATYGLGFFGLVGAVLYGTYIHKILSLCRVPR